MIKETIEMEMYLDMRKYFSDHFPRLGERRRFRKGERIDQDAYGECCKFIIKGMLKISVLSKSGDQKLFLIMRSGEMYDEYPKYGICDLEIVCAEDSEVVFFRIEEVYEKLENPAQCMEYLLYSLKRKQSVLMMQASSLYFDDIVGRIASLVIRTAYQCGRFREDKGECQLDYCFTHEEIASFVGCSRVTVTRHLKELTERKIIDIINRHIVIKDIQALEALTSIR